MSSRNRNRGKALERFVAADLGGRRTAILGQEDVMVHGMAIECKERQRLPAFITKCMAQAEENARGDVAVVILHELNQGHERDIVMLRYLDFKAILKNGGTQ